MKRKNDNEIIIKATKEQLLDIINGNEDYHFWIHKGYTIQIKVKENEEWTH